MRYRWIGTTLLGLILTATATGLRAEESGPMKSGMEHHWDTKKIQKELGLSDDQAVKLQAIVDSEKAAMKTSMDKNKDLMKKLEGQVNNKANDTDLQATLADIRANHKAMMEQMEQFRSQKDALLTPSQQAKLLIHHMHHFHGMMHSHEVPPSDKPMKQDADNNKG